MKTGILLKLKTTFDTPIKYELSLENETINLNDLIGKKIQFKFNDQIFCISCGKKTKKSFMQGFCYPCMMNSPEASECILRPELCLAHEGKGRDIAWEETFHLTPHFVYLAKSSAIKVGITRESQIPTRWIDQGASEAIIICKTPNRYLAGLIEVSLKSHITDKTQWQSMLKNIITDEDLEAKANLILTLIPEEFRKFIQTKNTKYTLIYPVINFPTKVTSLSFDKTPEITEKLLGIKGQYLLFDGGKVLNIRKFSGYQVDFNLKVS